jgi:hypothetical protein
LKLSKKDSKKAKVIEKGFDNNNKRLKKKISKTNGY